MVPKIIFFDCDGVLTFGEPIEKLNIACGISKAFSHQLFLDYYARKITFKDWNNTLLTYYKKAKLTESVFRESCFNILSILKYMTCFLLLGKPALRVQSYQADLMSMCKNFANQLGMKYWRANFRAGV